MQKWWLLTFVLVGCGDNYAAPPDAAPDAPAFAEATHGSPAQLINVGGPVLTAPKVQPIFFASDAAMQAQMEPFLAQLGASPYWSTTTAEYGVGAITALPTIVTSDPPPTTDAALTTWLASHFDGTHDGWPTVVDPQTIYSVYLPAGVVLHTEFGDSCSAFGGYHDEAVGLHGESIVYALMPRCGMQGALDSLTSVTSHELIEASTDPLVETNLAFGDADAEHYVMAFTPGAEAGDYCEYLPSANQRLVGNYMVQRTWSNVASAAGTDPCVPAMATPFVGAAAITTDDLTVDFGYGPVVTKGLELPLHGAKTVDVALYSDTPTDAFTVRAIDVGAEFTGTPVELEFSFNHTGGRNGDMLQLTITRVRNGQLPGSEFLIEAKNGMHTAGMWWGFVAN